MTVTVPERGQSDITATEWRALQTSPDFWRLVDSNVVAVSAHHAGGARLLGSSYVGRALCGSTVIECQEKISGALVSLLQAGTPVFKASSVPAPATDLGSLVTLLVRAFITQVRDYVGRGRDLEYVREHTVSSLAGGRLVVPRTVLLRARGLRHLASFERQLISHATDVNRLVYAGLREIEVLANLVNLGGGDLADARSMSLFFEDCRDVETVFGSSAELASQARSVAARHPRDDAISTMLALASVLLSHNSFEPGSLSPGVIPFSWFINLETLFEQAVRARLADVTFRDVHVVKGGRPPAHVFPDSRTLLADPDLVVYASEVLVGDVKYKEWSGSASASDLYQLLVHASSLGARKAFLVYPSDRYEEIRLGTSVIGTEARLFSIDVRKIDDGLSSICESLGIKVASSVTS